MQNNINESIFEEIKNNSKIPSIRKSFLKWLLNFEQDNSNKEQFQYKKEFQYKAREILENA